MLQAFCSIKQFYGSICHLLSVIVDMADYANLITCLLPACRSFGGGTSPCATPLGNTPNTSAQSSPSMRTKRYVLSTATKRDTETQTVVDIWSLEEQESLSTTELQSTLLQVRETVTALNEENEVRGGKCSIIFERLAKTHHNNVHLKLGSVAIIPLMMHSYFYVVVRYMIAFSL